MIELYTIGFTEKSAESFFNLLKNANIEKIIDTRINNSSQLSGFAKASDLKFFAKELCDISYQHNIDFAPTKDLLKNYRDKKLSWEEYEIEYLNLLDIRNIKSKVDIEELHKNCFLCSEHTAEKCHRRLLAEYFKHINDNVKIIHLIK